MLADFNGVDAIFDANLRPSDPEFPDIPKRVAWRPDLVDLNRLWWKKPEKVKILFYMDGAQFLGSPCGFSLDHVINAIQSDPWPWATFDITTANRGSDGSADLDNVGLDDVELEDYDELFIFGFSSSTGALSANEIATVEQFMDDGGGVFNTGDHAQLGRGMLLPLKRVGKLRKYGAAAPTSIPNQWNTTLRDGNNDGNFAFAEQSDAVPQEIRPRYWYGFSGGLGLKKFPHPVLCANSGVVRVLPDHEHEGECNIPSSFPVSEWPRVGPRQPRPEVIAWGKIIDPDAVQTGTEFAVVSAYDGQRANVGRIVTDSTWHHWFNINLKGFNPMSQDYRDIMSYFQNVAAWLAPKNKQRGMRNGVFWLALHEASFQQVNLKKVSLSLASKTARDALGRWAPQCMVHGWLVPLLPDPVLAQIATTDPAGPRLQVPVEDVVLVEALTELQQHFDVESGVLRPAENLGVIEEALTKAIPRATSRLVKDCEDEMKAVLDLQDKVQALTTINLNGAAPKRRRSKAKAEAA